MADIDHDARAFKAWITKEKALNFQTSEFEEERLEQDVSLFPSSFDQSAALIVLRACKVNVVSIAAGLQEIIVGLEIMPSRRDETALPSRTRSGRNFLPASQKAAANLADQRGQPRSLGGPLRRALPLRFFDIGRRQTGDRHAGLPRYQE